MNKEKIIKLLLLIGTLIGLAGLIVGIIMISKSNYYIMSELITLSSSVVFVVCVTFFILYVCGMLTKSEIKPKIDKKTKKLNFTIFLIQALIWIGFSLIYLGINVLLMMFCQIKLGWIPMLLIFYFCKKICSNVKENMLFKAEKQN